MVLHQEDCINITDKLLREAQRATTLLPGEKTGEVCRDVPIEDPGEVSTELRYQELC